jgi:hypothetical protein
MKESNHGRDPLASRAGDARPSGGTPPRWQQEGAHLRLALARINQVHHSLTT